MCYNYYFNFFLKLNFNLKYVNQNQKIKKMDISSANNSAIRKFINDTLKPYDCIWFNENMEKHIKPLKENAIKYIIELAGRPYLYIHKIFIDLILEWNQKKVARNFYECPLNLFHIGEIYELPTKEVCEFIKQSYDKIDADMIYIHGSSTGLEEHAIIQSGVFDTILDIKSFDKYPNPIYCDDVYKMNVKDPIPDCDKDKRILVVCCYPTVKMFRDIITGLRINKDNYVGIVFIGDLVRGHCLPKEYNKYLNLCNWNLIEFGTENSICFNDILDAELAFKKYNYINGLTHFHRESQQMFYINENIPFPEKPLVVQESLVILDTILKLSPSNVLVLLMIEQIYLTRYYGISWDINLDTIPQLNNLVIDKVYETYKSKNNTSDDTLPEEIVSIYFNTITSEKFHLDRLLFVKQDIIKSFERINREFLSMMTMKTNVLYKINIIREITTVDKYRDKYFNYCDICFKNFNFKCSGCKIAKYCSKKCQIIDCKVLDHDCVILKSCQEYFGKDALSNPPKEVSIQIKQPN